MKQQQYDDIQVPTGTRINVFRTRDAQGYLDQKTRLTFSDGRAFWLRDSAESQLFNHMDSSIRTLRKEYEYDWKTRNQVSQELLDNRLADQSRKALILRVLKGTRDVAGVVTDLYAAVSHSEVFQMAETIMTERAMNHEVIQKTLTSKKGYRTYILDRWIGEAMDRQQIGLVISNSEVGLGSVGVYLYLRRQVCSNGMMASVGVSRARLRHIGDSGLLKETLVEMIETTLDSAESIMPAWQVAKKVSVSVRETQTLLSQRMGYPKHLAIDMACRVRDHEGETAYGVIQAMTWTASHNPNCAKSYKMKLQQDAHKLLMETYEDPSSIKTRLEEVTRA